METIKALAETAVQTAKETTSTPPQRTLTPGPDRERVSQLFRRMRSVYGHKWRATWKTRAAVEEAMAEWALDLQGVSDEALADGFERMKAEYADWPPTLPEFKRLCVPVSEPTAPYHKPFSKALPASPSDPSVAEDAITRMRRSVRGLA